MGKSEDIKETSAVISRVMLPEDANPVGIIHGGVIMKEIDNAAAVVAVRHTRRICVTASIDRIEFHKPSFIGNLITVKAAINMTGTTSMEIGARVEAEDLLSGKVTHLASAYLTFVALDKSKKPTRVPPLAIHSDEGVRRNREALARKALRYSEKEQEHEYQGDTKEEGV